MIGRWIAALGILVLIGGLAWFGLPEAKQKVREQQPAIAFALPDLQGTSQSLPLGEVILLNFWATWCPPCRQEMPSMVRLYEKYKDQGLKVVAVSVDKNKSALDEFVAEYKLPFTVLHDIDAMVSEQYGVHRYPESFLIGRDGIVQIHQIGAIEWTSDVVTAAVEQMLSSNPSIDPNVDANLDAIK
ncbi:MAG: thioredoxin family protein [Zetaproteobacteria bacterium CG_4_9_14_3_um_filter_49_83]|nr:MAG: thioredoxin family protein [Zetaproteobacteria bacterium CG1_02_49_23]PIQ30846.1 MAG: thioredoxin family protein [Zetaproteobacteria bacterium CG17_big_fil_post_rev_8_21_14_2_50_50_13]PIV30746.1 MAG: thioredoxin family protein [Zetaproteobacteria bacterium CG02_land_8_20_14_3_00_50_9]PIY56102.1 MAG: thioredoxin family protein [Zetaproteobacteria bacterium CG_4_10_14_0_8_um_filter_49_80]PJA34542.1 MAG: thioredoxin family protein [Zetaproteobacteria bacterium CG_4_9_14_3_um_filter_49_83]